MVMYSRIQKSNIGNCQVSLAVNRWQFLVEMAGSLSMKGLAAMRKCISLWVYGKVLILWFASLRNLRQFGIKNLIKFTGSQFCTIRH